MVKTFSVQPPNTVEPAYIDLLRLSGWVVSITELQVYLPTIIN